MRYRNFSIVKEVSNAHGLRIQLKESDPEPGVQSRYFEAELGVVLDLGTTEEGQHPLFGNLIRHYTVANSQPWWPNSTPWEDYDGGN